MGPVRRLASEYARAFKLFSRDAKLFLLGSFLVGVGQNLVSLLLTLYLKRLGHDEARIGAFLSAGALGSVLVTLPASYLIARIDPRRFLPASAALACAAYAAQALASSGAGIGAGVLLAGAFVAVFQVAAGPFFMRSSGPEERMHLFALYSSLSFSTGIVGSLVAGLAKDALAAATGDEVLAYRATILLGAAFVLSALLPFSQIRGEGRAADRAATDRPPAQDVRLSAPRGDGAAVAGRRPGTAGGIDLLLYFKVLFPGLLSGVGAGLTIPYLNLYFKNVFAMSDSAIGAVVAAAEIATLAGMAAAPALYRRLGGVRSIVLSEALSVPFMLLLTFSKAVPLALTGYFVRQTLMNLSTPLQDNFALEIVPPAQQHLMNALKLLLWTGAWMVAARISGSLIARGSFTPSFVSTAALYALSTALFWAFFVVRRRRLAPGTAGDHERLAR